MRQDNDRIRGIETKALLEDSRKDGISTFARGHKDLSWSPLLGELSLI